MTGASRLARDGGLPLSAAALFLLLSVAYVFSIDIRASRGASTSGDEPFYLLTTQSLISDQDLDLSNQYEQRSYESFFDHPDGLWKQSVPTGDGRLLSPHNPGLAVLLIPGFALGGLVGAQVQLLLVAAAAMVLGFLLADRITGRRAICWTVTLAVGLSATAFIYSTEVYPEFPAALALLACMLVVTRRSGLTGLDAVWLAVGASAVCWLGIKYAPLVLLPAAYFLYRADGQGRAILLGLGGVSAVCYAWFHLATFDGLTPYSVNVVYAGMSSIELIDRHAELGDRAYRLWGLFVDRRFGVGRWAPVLLMAAPGLALLAFGDSDRRLVLVLIVVQLLLATFMAITMMGWWFPGRTLLTVFPLLVVPLASLAAGAGPPVRAAMLALAAYSLAITAGLAQAGRTGEVTIAVDPFDMSFPPFQAVSRLFPQYTSWTWETWTLTVLWLVVAGAAIAVTGVKSGKKRLTLASWPNRGGPCTTRRNGESLLRCPQRGPSPRGPERG